VQNASGDLSAFEAERWVLRDVMCFMSAISLPSSTLPLFSAVKQSDILPNVIKQIKGLFAIQIMGSELSASDVRFTFSLHVTRDFWRPPCVDPAF
jgi:hypothetical protein